jgi:hypothetical protein
MAIAARQQRLPMIRPYGAVGSCEPETEAEFVEPTHGGQRTLADLTATSRTSEPLVQILRARRDAAPAY